MGRFGVCFLVLCLNSNQLLPQFPRPSIMHEVRDFSSGMYVYVCCFCGIVKGLLSIVTEGRHLENLSENSNKPTSLLLNIYSNAHSHMHTQYINVGEAVNGTNRVHRDDSFPSHFGQLSFRLAWTTTETFISYPHLSLRFKTLIICVGLYSPFPSPSSPHIPLFELPLHLHSSPLQGHKRASRCSNRL